MPAHHGSGSAYHGAGQSHVGHDGFYEAGDQRNEPRSVLNERDRYKEGRHGCHQNLSTKDPNTLAHLYSEHEHGHREHAHDEHAHQKSHKHHGTDINAEAEIGKIDPRKPVCCVAYKRSMVDWVFADTLAHSLQASLHGHKPSRGAELDWELQQDDEKRLREMGLK